MPALAAAENPALPQTPVATSTRGLRFATGPANGAALALQQVQRVPESIRGKNTDGTLPVFQVSPPIEYYDVDPKDVTAGNGLKKAAASSYYAYLVSAPNGLSLDISIPTRPAFPPGLMHGIGVNGAITHALEIAHPKLPGLKEVTSGSYEVRLVLQQSDCRDFYG